MAKTSNRWMRLPATWNEKPSNHRMSKITAMVQSISEFSNRIIFERPFSGALDALVGDTRDTHAYARRSKKWKCSRREVTHGSAAVFLSNIAYAVGVGGTTRESLIGIPNAAFASGLRCR